MKIRNKIMINIFQIIKNKEHRNILIGASLFFVLVSFITALFNPATGLQIFVAIITFFLFFLFPEIGLYLMVIFSSFINWYFTFFSLYISFIDLLSIVVISLFVIRNVYLGLFTSKKVKIYFPAFLPFLLFFMAVTISNLLSEYRLGNIWYSIRWILFFYIVYVVFPVNIIKNKRIFKNTLICFVISGVLIAISGVLSLFTQDWYGGFIRIKPFGLGSFYPFGENHNLIAEALVVSTFFTYGAKHFFKSLRLRRFFSLLAIFQVAVLMGTFSKAGWIGLFAGVILYIVYFYNKLPKKVILSIVMGIILLLPLSFYMIKIQKEQSIGGSATKSRMVSIEIAIEKFKQKPLFGHGTGQFIPIFEENIRFTAKYGKALDAHGVWQKILVENGLVGWLFFCIFIFNILYLFYTNLKKYKKYEQALLPIMLGILGICIIQIFNTSYYNGKTWLPVALGLASFNVIREFKIKKARKIKKYGG